MHFAAARAAAMLARMYVRWQTRKRPQGKQAEHWAAILVSMARVGGNPTQQHIAYLGGITKAAVKDTECRVQFWVKASSVLAGLGDQLSSEQRRKIEAALAARVPKPSNREMLRHSRALRRDSDPPRLLGLADEQHDLEIELEEEQERA
jgi:hypothetical protein